MPDIYGTDLLIGPDGDLQLAPNRDLAIVSGPYNAAQAVTLRIRTQLGELDLHPEFGSNLFEHVGGKDDPAVLRAVALAELRRIEQDPRLLAADDVTVELDGKGTVVFGARVRLTGGEQIAMSNLERAEMTEVIDPELEAMGEIDLIALDDLELEDLPDETIDTDPIDLIEPTP